VKATGIVRRVDELGRIVLPVELRRTLDIEEKDQLEIFLEEDKIILRKFDPACLFCGGAQELVSYKGKNVCQSCLDALNNQ
jgi:transcriptional pleiotropic regulator of transition state genes